MVVVNEACPSRMSRPAGFVVFNVAHTGCPSVRRQPPSESKMNPSVLDGLATAACLPFTALADELEALLRDDAVHVPPRLVQALPLGGSLFVMPAHDAFTAIAKVISFTPGAAARGQPTIQGDVLVFDVERGDRVLMLDGPTVTARRTAAVTLAAWRRLAPARDGPIGGAAGGPMLIVGAGVQGWAHLEAFAEAGALPPGERVHVASRGTARGDALVRRARDLGFEAQRVDHADAVAARCRLVVCATPATATVLRGPVHDEAFVAAVGAFTPSMAEIDPALCRRFADSGRLVLDASDARHEAGDLLQANIDTAPLACLGEVVRGQRTVAGRGPLLFKSCGWAGWDLAAARLARRRMGV